MKKLFMYSKRYWGKMAAAAMASVAASVSTVMVIDLLREIIDLIAEGQLQENLSMLIVRMGIVIAAGLVSNFLVVEMTGQIGAGLLKDLRQDSLDSLMNASIEYLNSCNYGDLMERMSEDIEGLSNFMAGYFKDCLYVPVITVVYSIYLFMMNAPLACICLFPLIIMVPLNIKMLKPVKLRQFQYVRELGLTNNNVEEAFAGAAVIKAYNLQQKMQQKYQKALYKTYDTSNKTDLLQYNLEPISRAIQEVPLALAICVGGMSVFSGSITIGILIAYISAIKKLIDPLSMSYQLVVRSQTAIVAVSRVFDIIEIEPENKAESELENGSESKQERHTDNESENAAEVLRFEHVTFAYDKEHVLTDVSFRVKAGEKIAFIGKSGGGKSTILKLISRQITADAGEIFYCGRNYRNMAPEDIRKNIALISQDTVLFPMSIADNIRIGAPEANREQIRRTLELAGCREFVDALSCGMDTILSEHGGNLSGGQRQRLAIARAIIKDAKVLLLDEPTSALDKDTEQLICHTIDQISEGRTVITVAHRMSTIRNYDQIYEVKDGMIQEELE